MLPEFDNLFDPTDPTFIGTVSKKYANEALDLFLNSEVNNTMANDLETYQRGCDKEDQTSGVHVLRYLQRRFARWTILMSKSKPGGALKPWLAVTTSI